MFAYLHNLSCICIVEKKCLQEQPPCVFLWTSLPEDRLRKEKKLEWATTVMTGVRDYIWYSYCPSFTIHSKFSSNLAITLADLDGLSCDVTQHHSYRVWDLSNKKLRRLGFLHVLIRSYHVGNFWLPEGSPVDYQHPTQTPPWWHCVIVCLVFLLIRAN